MTVCMMVCAKRMHARRSLFAAIAFVVFGVQGASADLDTSPYHFTEQGISSTGHFEWDEFNAASGSISTFFTPDTASTGIGVGSLSLDYTPQSGDGPPFALVTTTDNIYSGGTICDFDVDLTSAFNAEAFTTIVMQVSSIGPLDPSSFLLNGTIAPTEFVDRGTFADVLHDIDDANAAFDTNYYWAEWQVSSASNFLLEFSHPFTHTSFAQVRVDYYNTATAFNATSPTAVPEPASASLLAAMGSVLLLRRRRCQPRS